MNKVAGEMKFLGGVTGLKTNLPGFEYSGCRITMVRTIDTHAHTPPVLMQGLPTRSRTSHYYHPNTAQTSVAIGLSQTEPSHAKPAASR